MEKYYLDNAATTKPYLEAVEAAMPYLTSSWGNASASYSFGQEARAAIERSREIIADTLGAEPEQIIFTSGATEANNMVLHNYEDEAILTTHIEHHSLLNTAESLCTPFYLKTDEFGRVDLEDVQKAIRDVQRVNLVSVMAANNEIGTVEPIKQIAQICREHRVAFHTDATQYYGHQLLNVNNIKADYISASAHKFGGVKGTGFLYARKRTGLYMLSPLILGGHQERNLRAGTENVFGIVAMAQAAKISCERMSAESVRLIELRAYLTKRVLSEIQGVVLTGDPVHRLPNNASFIFEGIRGEELVELLGMYGVYGSSGSACETGTDEPSHVLKAIGVSDEEANGSLRLTLGRDTTKETLDYAIEKLKKAVTILRGKNE